MGKILVGVFLVVVGIAVAVSPSFFGFSDGVMCGTDVMQPGDSCIADGDSLSYEQMLDSQQNTTRVLTWVGRGISALGCLVVLIGIIQISVRAARRPRH